MLERLYAGGSQASIIASSNELGKLSSRLTVSSNVLPNLSSVSGWHANVGAFKTAFSMPIVHVLNSTAISKNLVEDVSRLCGRRRRQGGEKVLLHRLVIRGIWEANHSQSLPYRHRKRLKHMKSTDMAYMP